MLARARVALRFDATRDRWVLLAPERVLVPDDIAVERPAAVRRPAATSPTIADDLAGDYEAPRDAIVADVIAMLQDLADKGFLIEAEA